jgi:hypothetical protein
MSRLFGQETQTDVGFRAHHMSKVDTDQGLGPGSERMRREVRQAQEELESRSKQKAAPPVVDDDKKNAVTEPGVGKVERKSDTVDDLLDGFGASRPDLPRILPNKDTTPPPEPVRKELTPTEPGKRQRTRNMVLATIVTFGVVVAVGVGVVKMGSSSSQTTPAPTTTTTAVAPTNTVAQVTTAQPTEVAPPPITTMPIESLPTAKTATPPPSTAKSVHSAPTATTATTAAATTTTTPRPTGSAPPGMNLLPDDPHR